MLLINRIRVGNERVSGPVSRLSHHFFLIVAMVTNKNPVETVLPFGQRGKDPQQAVFIVNVSAQRGDLCIRIRPTQYYGLRSSKQWNTTDMV